jgi:membrane protein DedA with SNARE-associated domain
MLKEMFVPLIEWYNGALQTGGYGLVGLLMAMESTIIPLPSEVIIPPAAHFAHTHPSGKLTVWGVVVAGTIGSWVGAALMYWVARWGGRPLILKYGKYVLIPEAKVHAAERWAAKFGSMGIFISRLLPVVRHLIGIPAGIVQMNFKLYSIYTLLGAGIWCAVLAWVGVKMGQDPKVMEGNMHQISRWLGAGMLIIGGLYYFFVHRHMKADDASKDDGRK